VKKTEGGAKSSTRAARLREASQQRREQEKREVREAILHAASELFLEGGYEKFSLRQVAERIGYSPGTIYLYFQDKDEVLFAVMDEGVAHLSRMLNEAATPTEPRERLASMGHAYVEFGLRYPAHFQLMFMQRPDFLLRRGTALPEPMIAIFGLWGVVVQDAMRAGILRMGDPVSTGDALWALLHGVVSIAILMPQFDQKRIHAMTQTAIEMMTNGLQVHD
jgi:AcrR family transcriptional regulator